MWAFVLLCVSNESRRAWGDPTAAAPNPKLDMCTRMRTHARTQELHEARRGELQQSGRIMYDGTGTIAPCLDCTWVLEILHLACRLEQLHPASWRICSRLAASSLTDRTGMPLDYLGLTSTAQGCPSTLTDPL